MQTSMELFAIAAMAENRVIGVNNQLPWHLPADLRRFKTLTTGHAILMGRKTHESIGRPLPDRLNLILSRNPHCTMAGCQTVTTIDQALMTARQNGRKQLLIIGGADIYRQFLPQVNRLYLTIVHQVFSGDALFPELNQQEWQEIEKTDHAADADNPYAFTFITLSRR